MNARFLEKLILYRQNKSIDFYKTILKQKIKYQFQVLNRTKKSLKYIDKIDTENHLNDLSLIEARAAKEYWKTFREKIDSKIITSKRNSDSLDPLNQLLNIGYHYLNKRLEKQFIKLNIPTEIGLFHKAQSTKAKPLIYDMMEWLRPFLIDKTLLSFLRKKKKKVVILDKKDIGKFLCKIKKAFEIEYYHAKLDYCVTLEYWSILILKNFINTVNKQTSFRPHFLSLRNESRCKK